MFLGERILLQAEIIAIGNEIISGLIQDTNGRFLSHQLHLLGINVARITAVGDDEGSIFNAVEEALGWVDVVIVTGGLGSTHDDITKGVLARVFNSEMIYDHKVMDILEVKFKERQQEVPERVLSQCKIPKSAIILYNEKGTAPGFLFKRGGKKLFSLPGVPSEMEHLFGKYVSPDLKKLQKGVIGHRVIKTVGLTEASLWEKFGSVESLERLVAVASLPSYMGVKIRLSHCSKSSEEIEIRLQKAEDMVMKVVGKWTTKQNH